MPPAARVGDMHVCPMVEPGPVPHVGGPILPPGCLTVLIGGQPAARMGDMATCVGPPDSIAMGSPTVKIGGEMAARMGDPTEHGGVIMLGFPTVMIGEAGGGGAGSGAGGGGGGANSVVAGVNQSKADTPSDEDTSEYSQSASPASDAGSNMGAAVTGGGNGGSNGAASDAGSAVGSAVTGDNPPGHDQTLESVGQPLTWPSGDAPETTPESDQAAQSVYDNAAQSEPSVTDALQQAAAQNGGKMEGLDYKLKTKSSLSRKINSDAKKAGTTASQAAAGIGDALRYTIILPEKGFGAAGNKILQDVAKNNTPLKVSNTFQEGKAYKGVNTVFQTPAGQKFELQLHTEKSFDMKQNVNHSLYEEARADGTSVARVEELNQQMKKNSASVPQPEGVESIRNF